MAGQLVAANEKVSIRVLVDGNTLKVEVSPQLLLIKCLREQMNVTAPHIGCESGRCGACSVVLDGITVKSCMVLAVQADDSEVLTAQSMASDQIGARLQAAFKARHGLQCGFCTPGMLAAARALLENNAAPTERDVRDALRGNLCRCTGYQHIVEAVLEASNSKEAAQ
jgi:carbon-monoxide dehydrogenase small subunit